jgi:hypothetical protein
LYTHTYYTVNRMEQLINCQQKNWSWKMMLLHPNLYPFYKKTHCRWGCIFDFIRYLGVYSAVFLLVLTVTVWAGHDLKVQCEKNRECGLFFFALWASLIYSIQYLNVWKPFSCTLNWMDWIYRNFFRTIREAVWQMELATATSIAAALFLHHINRSSSMLSTSFYKTRCGKFIIYNVKSCISSLLTPLASCMVQN